MKFSFLYILFSYVYYVLGDTSFISKGQRAELFEIMDNEVPTFKITLPEEEFLNMKERASQLDSLEYINSEIEYIIGSINEQNFQELFPDYDFSELLPLDEEGFPNIDDTLFKIDYIEYHSLAQKYYNINEIIFNVLNNNEYINIIKVLFIIYTLDTSSITDTEMWYYMNTYVKNVIMDEDGNLKYIKENYFGEIRDIVDSLNKQNFNEIFPEYNFNEILPELPMNENGHPNIDFQKYIISKDEYQNLTKTCESLDEVLFNIFNNNKYLNLIKVFNILSKLDTTEKNYDDDIWYNIEKFGTNLIIGNNGNFSYRNLEYVNEIKEIVSSLNEQNFNEIFPKYNFSEILPELQMNEEGYPNIDYQQFIIPYDEYQNLMKIYNNVDEVYFNIFKNNKYLNLVNVFYTISNLNTPSKNDDIIWYNIEKYGNTVIKNDDGNFIYINYRYVVEIKKIIDVLNEQDFNEIFPKYNITEIVPELPMNENGHPNIDFRKFIDLDVYQEYKNLVKLNFDFTAYYFNILKNNKYFNLIKVLYTLSQLDMNLDEDSELNEIFEVYGANNVEMKEDGDFIYYDSYKKFNRYNTYNFNKHFENYNFKISNSEEEKIENSFKTKNATMIVEINNQKKSFNKVTFSLGGRLSRNYSKQLFNLKIRGGKELFGRRQFKLRSDATEPSYIRTKLMCDIYNKLGLPSLSANYITLFINDEYMGFYILTDAFKESWIEYVYGEKDTTNLYKCEDCDFTYNSRYGFKNENNEATDTQELYEFLAKMTKAKSITNIESFFDIDQFYKEIAIEFLSYGWDHYINHHNYYIYKNPQNNKWIYLNYDYDLDLGSYQYDFIKSTNKSFNNMFSNETLLSNTDRFNEILKEIVIKVFNPATLFPRIDEIKSFIRPYVQLDKTPDANGEYPGKINKSDYVLSSSYTMEQWEDSTEFDESMIGLKQFILLRYRYVCKEYNIECDPNYLDENINMNLTITEMESLYPTETETSSFLISTSTIDSTLIEITTSTSFEDTVLPTSTIIDDTILPTSTIIEDTILPTSTIIEDTILPTSSIIEDTILPTSSIIEDTILPTSTIIEDIILPTSSLLLLKPTETETLPTVSDDTNTFKCSSEIIGYPCCSSELSTVYAQDEYGDWSYDFTKNEWCGLTKYEDFSPQDHSDECWSEKLGYPCCKRCKIYETDSDGSWGYELSKWCGIISSRCQKK